jgi:hypothetical protein
LLLVKPEGSGWIDSNTLAETSFRCKIIDRGLTLTSSWQGQNRNDRRASSALGRKPRAPRICRSLPSCQRAERGCEAISDSPP